MRFCREFGLVTAYFSIALLGAACSAADVTQPQRAAISDKPRTVWTHRDGWCNPGDGGFSDAECDTLQRGIDMLSNSTNSYCASLGSLAQDALNTWGFMPGSSNSYDMYQYMNASSSTYSGYQNSLGLIYVDGDTFNHNDKAVAGLIAHEMEHWNGDDGPQHNTGLAEEWQNTCLGTFA